MSAGRDHRPFETSCAQRNGLRADLKAFRDRGIVDERGKRVHREVPAETLDEASDVV